MTSQDGTPHTYTTRTITTAPTFAEGEMVERGIHCGVWDLRFNMDAVARCARDMSPGNAKLRGDLIAAIANRLCFEIRMDPLHPAPDPLLQIQPAGRAFGDPLDVAGQCPGCIEEFRSAAAAQLAAAGAAGLV